MEKVSTVKENKNSYELTSKAKNTELTLGVRVLKIRYV